MIRKTKPKRAKNAIVTVALAALKRRSRKRVTSIMGLSTARSTSTNTTTSTADRAKPVRVSTLSQPCPGASMMVQVSRPRAATEITKPGRSMRGTSGSRDSGTKATASTMVASPIGTISQKMLFQLKCSSSRPPVTGPRATPTPEAAPHRPIAAARSRRSTKVLEMIDSVVGKISAAKTPIATRAAINALLLSTSAAAALLAAKPARPTMSAGRRPYLSDRLPMARTRAAKARL